jgi:cation diffusion facilitator family transporter
VSTLADNLTHEHVFLGSGHSRNERRIWFVIALTMAMMIVEIGAGTVFGSMALVADGWHMSTHASALLIAALAYFYARRQAHNPRFTFGTGKLGDLASFASAIILALVALLMGWESLLRLWSPVAIDFREAIAIAVVGLAVNLLSAWLLRDDHDHHGHDHAHGHDNNLRSAYVHVLADAMTSVLAIVALTLGSRFGWSFLDPLMGIVGGLVIAQWSWGLLRSSGGVLLDFIPKEEDLPEEIREIVETGEDRITDLHVWQVGPGHHAAIVAVVTPEQRDASFYKTALSRLHDLSHVTVEVTVAKVT